MSREFTEFAELMQISSKEFYPFKDFQSDQIQSTSRKIKYSLLRMQKCRFEFDPSNGTTKGFFFQIINTLTESWGVRLTCLDCIC